MNQATPASAFWLREIIVLTLCATGGLVIAPAIEAGFADDPNSTGLYIWSFMVAWAIAEAMFSLKRTVIFSLGSRVKV